MNSGGTYFESLAEGVQQGLCNMSDVDKALEHTLGLRFELGLFDPIEDQRTPRTQLLSHFTQSISHSLSRPIMDGMIECECVFACVV
jgi:hypothetical protein